MRRTPNIPELDYLPVRNGGEDQLHAHPYSPSEMDLESCGACAQLRNDFMWIRFNDAVAGREAEFGNVADAMKYAVVNVERKYDARADFRARDQVAVA